MAKDRTAIAIAVFLMASIAVTLVAFPSANAHDPAWTVPTWCYCAVTNNVIGVNQQENIIFWVNAIPPTAQGAYGDRWTFWIDITKPDSDKETLGPYTSDPVGGGWAAYTPTQVGTYTVVVRMDKHTVTGLPDTTPSAIRNPASINDIYLASSSDPVEFIAQETPIQPWPEAPLPAMYWTRPINNANRNWYVLAGNWLAGAAQNVGPTTLFGYGTAPESAHVMWATPMWSGGTMDERFDNTGYQTSHYEGLFFVPPIVIDGRLYYNVQSLPREGWYCLDLYTGETLYFHNTTGPVTGVGGGFAASGAISREALSFGQIYNYESPNQHGGFPYLWSTSGPDGTWMMFDAYSGNYICSIANVSAPRGSVNVYGKDGSILYYSIEGSGANKRLTVWNTSQTIWYKPYFASNDYWMWRPVLNKTFDGNNGFSLNVSIPDVQGSIRAVREDQYIIGGNPGSNNEQGIVKGNLWALSLEPGKEGTLLWNREFTPPSSAGNTTVAMCYVDPEDGVFLFWNQQLRQWYGYSLGTGQLLWTGEPEIAWSYYSHGQGDIYQGMLLSFGDGCAGGELVAYNITTGEIVWKYEPSQVGFESPYGVYPIGITCIADGKIYLVSGEHSPTQPLWRGSYLRCINASNGAELWKVLHWGSVTNMWPGQGTVVVADGFLIGLNLYDNQIYCYGKGPSATTVTASPEVTVHGSSVLIKGAVTDQCVGAKKIAEKVGFIDGVPAVSDASQEGWMEWLYAQQGKPKNATGVDVVLETLDPNGNFYEIGRTTSDASGMYSYAFTPEVPGKYTIIATFEGSNAYYGSSAETAINVEEAPQATPTPPTPSPSMADTYFVPMSIGMIIAVIAVGLLLVLMLRKR